MFVCFNLFFFVQILIYRSSNMHLFLSNSILPFTQTQSFFVITLFYRWFHSHFFLSSSCSIVHWTFIFFGLKFDTILPVTQTSSFFLRILFYCLFNSLFSVSILVYCSLKLLFLTWFYSSIFNTSTFFCLHPILLFTKPSSLFFLNFFYHWIFFSES